MKTHYEKTINGDLFGVNEQFVALERELGNEFTFEQMIRSDYGKTIKDCVDKTFSAEQNLNTIAASHMNMVYHMYHFKKNHHKIYEISQNLAEMLLQTKLSKIPSMLLKSPFREIILEIPNNLLKIYNEETGIHNVYNIYVNFIEYPDGKKEIRTLLVALPNEKSIAESDDATFYFKLYFEENDEIEKLLHEHVEIMKWEHNQFNSNNELLFKNILLVEKIFNFVLNCLLYITGAECDIKYINRGEEIKRKWERCRGGKKNKLERMMNNAGFARYLVGGSIILSRQEREEYEHNRLYEHGKHSVRYLVQGHWRNQSCGEGRTQHKLIWIKPFWKGPELSQVVSRIHKVQ